jgi:RNA polymerase sigma-70 factor (ECF subfamily)
MELDEELYRKIRQGDLSAFEVLYERHKRGLFGFIHGYVKNREEAEEVFHEAFLQVLKSNEVSFREGSFQGWLYLVARNLCLNRIRSRRRGEKAVSALEPGEETESAEALLMGRDQSQQLQTVLEKLPETLAQVLKLRLSGMAHKDIALVLKIPVGTVKSRFHTLVEFIKTEIQL